VTTDTLKVFDNVPIREAKDLEAEAFEVLLPPCVRAAALFREVLIPVKLDHQLGLGAIEIDDIITDWPLTAEADGIRVEKVVPEVFFLRGHVAAEGPGAFPELEIIGKAGHIVHSPLVYWQVFSSRIL
jgi:hypothetical protein